MYEENRTSSVMKDILLQVILVIIFVFLLLWLFPTKWDVKDQLKDGFDPLYQQLFNDHINTMKESAQSYYTTERLPKKVGDKVSITLGEMLDKKLLTSFVDSNNKQCNLTGSYVEITKMDKEYMMKVNLNCSDKSDYIITYMGCYNYCEDDICEKQETTTNNTTNNITNNTTNNTTNNKKDETTVTPTPVVKKYEYEYELITEGKFGEWSSWSSWSTDKVSANDYRKVETKTKKEAVGTVSTGTTTKYVAADKKTTTKTYTAQKTLQCPTGYTAYGSGMLCVANPKTGSTTTVDVIKQVPVVTETDAIKTTVKVCPDGNITTNDWCFATISTNDEKPASKGNTVYSDWKYSDTKQFTYKPSNTTTTKYEYVQTDTVIECKGCSTVKYYTYKVYTRTATTTYNCNNYSGYTLSGTKCIKATSSLTSVYGTWHEEDRYSCADGSTPVNGKCTTTTYVDKEVTDTTNKCDGNSYDAATGLCYVRGQYVYKCPTGIDGEIDGQNCVVETTKYSCDEGTLVGKKCKIKETKYETEYENVTYYRYKTREYISGSVQKTWSSSNNDTDLINKGYTLTGNKREV